MNKKQYEVLTWDLDKQIWTPQMGVCRGPYTKFGLRKALRKLQLLCYSCDRQDSYVLVQKIKGE